jgi:hypothetical protein
MKEGNEQTVELNEKTKVPLGVVIACLTVFIGGALWITNSLNRIDNRLIAMETRMTERWTAADMKLWAMQLRMENPSLKVPEAVNQK